MILCYSMKGRKSDPGSELYPRPFGLYPRPFGDGFPRNRRHNVQKSVKKSCADTTRGEWVAKYKLFACKDLCDVDRKSVV